MMTTNPTRTAVEVTATRLRSPAGAFSYADCVYVADMMGALLARVESAETERDALRWSLVPIQQIATARANADLTAARETIAAKDTEIARLTGPKRKCPIGLEENHNLCSAGTCSICEADLRATIARLTAEVQAAREALKFAGDWIENAQDSEGATWGKGILKMIDRALRETSK